MVERKSNDALGVKIEALSEKVIEYHERTDETLKDIRGDLKEIRSYFDKDITELKLSQASCTHKWSIVQKVLSFGGIGSALTWIVHKVLGGS